MSDLALLINNDNNKLSVQQENAFNVREKRMQFTRKQYLNKLLKNILEGIIFMHINVVRHFAGTLFIFDWLEKKTPKS